MDRTILESQDALETQARSLDAVVGLLSGLDVTASPSSAALHALTASSSVVGAQRSALLICPDSEGFELLAVDGLRRQDIDLGRWWISERFVNDVRDGGGVAWILDRPDLPGTWKTVFDLAVHLSHEGRIVGLMFLGGIGDKSALTDLDFQLLGTLGVVIGAMLQQVKVQQELFDARIRLDEAQRMRKSIVDHVSHEFNTPLLIVKSTGDMIRTATGDDRNELLDMHGEAVQRLEQLVGSILRVAKEFDGNVESEVMPLTMLARQIVDPWLIREADPQNLRCILESSSEVFVRASAMRIEIILKELLDNARAAATEVSPWVVVQMYSAPEGWWVAQDHEARIRLYADALATEQHITGVLSCGQSHDLQMHGGPQEVVLEVMDFGRGIPEDELRMIFEPFAQGRQSSRRGVEGAGMGLPTCRHLASEMSGQVLLRSTEGRGTTVALLLPVCSGI